MLYFRSGMSDFKAMCRSNARLKYMFRDNSTVKFNSSAAENEEVCFLCSSGVTFLFNESSHAFTRDR